MNEVVFGVQFKEIQSLLAPHLGRLWEKFRCDYPRAEEVPPLAHVVESQDRIPEVPPHFQVSNRPDLPRTWFVHQNDSQVLQVQRDRFLLNWRQRKSAHQYPRFSEVWSRFDENFRCFTEFIAHEGLGAVEPDQYELTYINHIDGGGTLELLRDIGKAIPDISWRVQQRYLPEPERLTWRVSFRLPDDQGRLHIHARDAIRRSDFKPIIILELLARGYHSNNSAQGMKSWFDLAHEWIVNGFTDITGEQMHALWQRS